MKLVFEANGYPNMDIETEDGGMAKIMTISGNPEEDDGMFVRLQSWSDVGVHTDMDALEAAVLSGKTLRVTVEIV